jgi:formylglycine-generating enzyme required for sulfatase activity
MRPAAALLIAVAAGSSLLWGTRCTSFQTAPGADAGAEGAPSTASLGSCPDGGGPDMVRIQTARGSFCIDVTEVTNGQYVAFLGRTENGAKATYPGPCPPADDALPRDGTTVAELARRPASVPVVFVDWCEAWAFCAWAGSACAASSGAVARRRASSTPPT